ncbi:DNA cytosine methyltransferase [Acetobacter aceti]|uniref:DNA cytosine methyltransferase n=1 Tax=Acetobacter aceti TaxID=435 RepID=UPI000C077F67|nr:DNA cytosine methyltransferase [Acetobacter aceti]
MTCIPPPAGIAMPYAPLRVLELFAGAAGGWTLGLHRAGFVTVAACEIVPWRRVLYAENNPHVRLYDDIRALTAGRLVSDLGFLPDLIAGSPPCQDISSANTRGKGIDGARSGLYLEAVRLVGECRPRWFAFENSANLRTRGADRLLDALEALGYAVEACVVGAGDIGACHVRKRSWLIGHDPAQLAHTGLAVAAGRDADGGRRGCSGSDEGVGSVRRFPHGPDGDATGVGCREGRARRRAGADDGSGEPSCGDAGNPDREPCTTGQRAAPVQGPDDIGAGRFRPHADDRGGAVFRGTPVTLRDVADTAGAEWRSPAERAGDPDGPPGERLQGPDRHAEPVAARGAGNAAHTHETRQPDGRVERCLRPAEITDDGRGDGWCDDGQGAFGPLGRRAGAGDAAAEPWADWNGGPAAHLRLDDGLSAWLARTRVALGDGRRASAASLVVEAFGDAVVPDIPEAIGHAILRVEYALDMVLARASAGDVS